MANLLISRVCNCDCPYCFAVEYLNQPEPERTEVFIGLDEFSARLDWLESSSIRQARLLGGEPSLHPRFPELLAQVASRGMQLLLFTHGWIPEAALQALESWSTNKCRVIINMNARLQGGDPKLLEARRRSVFQRLGKRAQPGFNISRRTFRLEPLIPLIQETGCRKAIRLGLAQPTLAGNNKYLLPKQYRVVGAQIASFAEQAAAQGIALEFDCGFVRCMFSESELDTLETARADVGWRCNPVLDVDLDGSVLHCFPLAAQFNTQLTNGRKAAAMRADLSAATSPYRQAGIFRECSTCAQKQKGFCTGGCLSNTIRRFSTTPFTITG